MAIIPRRALSRQLRYCDSTLYAWKANVHANKLESIVNLRYNLHHHTYRINGASRDFDDGHISSVRLRKILPATPSADKLKNQL